jgi:hypothetical protein
METETQTLIAEMRYYITADECNAVMDKSAEVGRPINGLANSLGRRARSDH